jgi:hypothetical protein
MLAYLSTILPSSSPRSAAAEISNFGLGTTSLDGTAFSFRSRCISHGETSMLNFLNTQRNKNLVDTPSASSSSSSPPPFSRSRPAPNPVTSGNVRAQQKQTLDPSQQLVTRLTVLLTPKKTKGALAGARTKRTDLKAVQRRANRCDGTSGICKKTGELDHRAAQFTVG